MSLKQLLLLLLIIAAVFGTGISYYFYQKYTAIKANPNLEAQKSTEALVAALGKLMELPKDETPTVATILDKEKLKDKPFFATVENGDVLLAYSEAKKAILYRPATNKIIDVAPINVNGADAPTPVVEPRVVAVVSGIRVAYYNGTPSIGLAGNAEKIIQEQLGNFETATLEKASRTDYQETLVIDLSGTHTKEAAEAAKLLRGKVAAMPAGEVRPDADILIISGQ